MLRCVMLVGFLSVVIPNARGQEDWDQRPVTDAQTGTPSDFVRFVRDGDAGHLDTAITTYEKDGVTVILFGAVHIADESCYQELNDRFTTCDALLYELVAPAGTRPDRNRKVGFNPIALLQHGMKNSMGLSFQLDVIDYQAENFVHADMTPTEFEESMAERGESLLSIMVDMMISGMERQREMADDPDAKKPEPLDLVAAFRNGEGRHRLRMAMATQMEEIEALAAGSKEGGSTLLEGRNEKCLEVLRREIDAGKKRIGIYYGAAHLPHMERRIVEGFGFHKAAHEWLVAWDCSYRKDPHYDRKLIKLRRRARLDLREIARAARWQRLHHEGIEPMTVAELRAAAPEADVDYAGPVEDPWGRDYVIERRPIGARWQFRSLGQDGVRGNKDDIVVQEPRRGGLLGF